MSECAQSCYVQNFISALFFPFFNEFCIFDVVDVSKYLWKIYKMYSIYKRLFEWGDLHKLKLTTNLIHKSKLYVIFLTN
jgi:hypothetical protein